MAAGAAFAAMPYLASLAGSVQAGASESAGRANSMGAAGAQASGDLRSLAGDGETLVLVIKNDIVSGFKGFKKVKLQDAQLAGGLRGVMARRFE